MDYTLDQIQNLKQALERQINQSLTQIVNTFNSETGLAVTAVRVGFIDISSLSQVGTIPSKVQVQLKANNQLIIDGDVHGQEQNNQG